MKIRNSLHINIGITFLNSFGVILATIIINGIISRRWGMEAVGDYNLIKRIVLSSIPLLMVGSNMVIPKLFAVEKVEDQVRSFTGYLLFFIILILPVYIVFYFILRTPGLLFNSETLKEQFHFIILVLVFANIVFQISYGISRGKQKFIQAAVINMLMNLVLPLFCFGFFKIDFFNAYKIYSLLMLSSVMIIIISQSIHHIQIINTNLKMVFVEFKSIFFQSITRVPAGIFQIILMSVPLILIAKYSQAYDLGIYASASNIVRFILLFIIPVNFVLLPKITELYNLHNTAQISTMVSHFNSYLYLISVVILPLILINRNFLFVLWLGPEGLGAAELFVIFILLAPVMLYTEFYRILLEAVYKYGVTSYILGTGSLILLAGFFGIHYLKISIGTSEQMIFSLLAANLGILVFEFILLRKKSILYGNNYYKIFSFLLIYVIIFIIRILEYYAWEIINLNLVFIISAGTLLFVYYKIYGAQIMTVFKD